MKKLKLSLAALALIFAVGSAFTSKTLDQARVRVFPAQGDPFFIPAAEFNATEDCDGGAPDCAQFFQDETPGDIVENGPYIGN